MSQRNPPILEGVDGTVTVHSDVAATTSAILQNNWTAIVAPTGTDDSSLGYAVGSQWVDAILDKSYILLNPALGAAVWKDITSTGGGGSSATLREVSATTTFATANETISCTSNTFTVNLPTAAGIQGTVYTLVNSGTGVITLASFGGEDINGSATISIKRQYNSRTVQSNGSDWVII